MALGWRRTPAGCRCRPRFLPPQARRTSTPLRVASRIAPCSRRRPRCILSRACILSKACVLSKARRRQRRILRQGHRRAQPCIRRRARRRPQPCIQRELHPMRHRIRRPGGRRSKPRSRRSHSRLLSRRRTTSTTVNTTSNPILHAAAGVPAAALSALAHYRQLDEAGIGAALENLDGRFLVVSGLGEEDVANIALRVSVVHREPT
jgi:hypothetical protein